MEGRIWGIWVRAAYIANVVWGLPQQIAIRLLDPYKSFWVKNRYLLLGGESYTCWTFLVPWCSVVPGPLCPQHAAVSVSLGISLAPHSPPLSGQKPQTQQKRKCWLTVCYWQGSNQYSQTTVLRGLLRRWESIWINVENISSSSYILLTIIGSLLDYVEEDIK